MRWDIFCRVIDNHGDLGVCWRLCADLASRGESVRLWVDDAAALRWMAPNATGTPAPPGGVEVRGWTDPLDLHGVAPGEVLVEAFGCAIAPEFIALWADAARARGQNDVKPVWINLEYLSAEPYVLRCHGMPSPVLHGPAAGQMKWFYYPGFTDGTGGVLRGPGAALSALPSLLRPAAPAAPEPKEPPEPPELPKPPTVSLFCYEPPALGPLLQALRSWRPEADAQPAADGAPTHPVRLQVTAGRAAAAVRAYLAGGQGGRERFDGEIGPSPASRLGSLLSISYLPYLSQPAFDTLLGGCDLNFVRGEDSLVRALWAAKPFVWHIYPQDDGAHQAKLNAFLDWLDAPASLRRFHRTWNGLDAAPLVLPQGREWKAWQQAARDARARLAAQADLATQLIGFVREKS